MKSKKTTILLLCSTICMTIVAGILGVLAVKNLSMTMSGSLDYKGYGVEATVSNGTITTVTGEEYPGLLDDASSKLQGFTIDNDSNNKTSAFSSQLSSWSGLALKPNELGDVMIKFSITNNMQMTPLIVEMVLRNFDGAEYNTTPQNIKLTYEPKYVEIPYGGTQEFTVIFDIIDLELPSKVREFSFTILLRKLNPGLFREAFFDPYQDNYNYAELRYYYLYMGIYKGQPVRWRYMSEDGVTPYDLTKGMPTSYKGYYILDSNIGSNMVYCNQGNTTNYFHTEDGLTDVYISDYATSDARKFLNNDLLSLLNIDSSDPVYQQIQARTLTDLYSDIYYENTEIPEEVQANFAVSKPELMAGSDKFWVPSRNEIMKMICGSDATYIKDNATYDYTYWTRTISSSTIYQLRIVGYFSKYYSSDGTATANTSSAYHVKPCFKIA